MTKMILSCDTGIDDALALVYAAGQRDLELAGVVVSYGMAALKNTYRNTGYILKLLGHPAPVIAGSAVPLSGPGRDYDDPKRDAVFHGRDGMGDMLGQSKGRDFAGTTENEGADFIVESVNRYGKDLVIVTTGPLTDLARALRKDPSIAEKVGAVVCMAGALAAPGNVSPFAEANVIMDSEAARLALESELPLTLVGLDVTRKTLLTKADLRSWQDIDTEAARLIGGAVEKYLDAYRLRYPYLGGCALHDPLAVGAALHPEWLTRVPMHLTAVTEGPALGRTCENLERCGDIRYTSWGTFGVDVKAFEADFFSRVGAQLKEEGHGSFT